MTATLQPESKSASRRALLTGALGGIGAWAATAIGRANPVRGAEGEAVVVGGDYTASTSTGFTTTTAHALYGISGSGRAIYGTSDSGVGLYGQSNSYYGVSGTSGSGVALYGASFATNQPASVGQSNGNSTGVLGSSGVGPAAKAKTGVFGYANQDTTATGVRGESVIGVGVRGKATTGYAGFFDGRVFTTRYYELAEIATPNAPAANQLRLFARDSGGKSQLCVRFHTGAVQVIKTEP